MNFCKGFFKKRKCCFFPKEWYVFCQRVFFSKGTGFQFFEGMFFFFKWFCFCCFCKTQGRFFFPQWLNFFFKKKFSSMFWKRKKRYFFLKKKGGCFFSKEFHFFKIFAYLKIKSFSFVIWWFYFQQTGFLHKSKFFFQRGVSLKMSGFTKKEFPFFKGAI